MDPQKALDSSCGAGVKEYAGLSVLIQSRAVKLECHINHLHLKDDGQRPPVVGRKRQALQRWLRRVGRSFFFYFLFFFLFFFLGGGGGAEP